jgi:hypothetical protein
LVKGEWKVKTRQRTPSYMAKAAFRQLTATHMKSFCADLSLNTVTDSEAFPVLSGRLTKIRAASADGATTPGSVTMNCGGEISALILPRKGAGYWPGEYADRNRAVANQRLTGSNARWKWTTDYNRRLDSGNGDVP